MNSLKDSDISVGMIVLVVGLVLGAVVGVAALILFRG